MRLIIAVLKKRKIEVAVISDIHLGTPECRVQELLAYLSSIRPKVLVLNGGAIDFKSATSPSFPAPHYKILKKILGMASYGTKVYYLLGEGEDQIRHLAGTRLGHVYIQKELVLDQDGNRTLIFHGSDFDALLGRLRGFSRLGGLGRGILGLWKRISKRNAGSLKESVAKYGIDKGWDTVICGHTHEPAKEWIETKNGQCLYLNSGDWTENLTALEYTFKRWKLYRYCEDKLSAFYADEELKGMDVNELLSSILDPRVNEGKQRAKNDSDQ